MKRYLLSLALFATPAFAQDAAPVCPGANADTAKALSATTSRYIGETEKNLEFVFPDADATVRGAALLFDEAEALFGTRGEVTDAHDRYANQEVTYLLAHRGPAIALEGFKRRAFAAGFSRQTRAAGLIVMETAQGVRTLEVRGMSRERAVALAKALAKVCG